ncbi:HMG box protein-like protein [Massariosphaeria phaeospora]|uniref:HMG box protein-like protein n=1 Tax=Massariosphaeria phaeospora TaxID=100035 RepID=A0A7C8I3J2_9PLEO|nr:HMG box protein-like protein [Massariosphaeria phaeospora]
MKTETLTHQHPPTPPNVSNELQSGLHQIAQYNAEGSYSFDGSHPADSRYGSPGPVVHEMIQQQPGHMDGHSGIGFGLGLRYDGYGQAPSYYPEGPYDGLPSQGMFSGSPPTPRSPTENEEIIRRTRSGRTLAPSSSPRGEEKPRPKATPRPKKAKAAKSEKPKTPKLTAPLSILTEGLSTIPVRDMKAWVERPVETRRKEVEKRNGYVTRPMNSFMLYRSAYAERTKHWCTQNNHQVVSSVSGESWPLEPPEVRDMYNDFAKIERINHQNAHPTYKFSPSKTAAPARKRKSEYSDEEPSDLEDAEWAPGHGRSKVRQSKRPDRSFSYPVHGVNTDFYDRSFGADGNGMTKSSWEMPNDGRPMPMHMPQGDLYNQYFQTANYPSMSMGPSVIDDMRLRRVDTPSSSVQFSPGHALLGLPGGNVSDFMQQLHSHAGTPMDEPQVDPMLLAFDVGQHHDVGGVLSQHPEFQNGHMGMIERELDQDSVHSLLGTGSSYDDFHPDSWHQDPNMAPLEQESEFEKWMGDQ